MPLDDSGDYAGLAVRCTAAYGDRLAVLDEKAGWTRVQLENAETAGWIHTSALTKKRIKLAAGEGDASFLEAKQATARFYFDHLLPRAYPCLVAVRAGSEPVMALTEDQF